MATQYPPNYPPGTSTSYTTYSSPPVYTQQAYVAQPVYTSRTTAVPANANVAVQNVHCFRCGAIYPLPAGATSWRCKQCQTMNGGSGLG